MSSFTAVVTSHENRAGLRCALEGLRAQTRAPEEILVFVSGLVPARRCGATTLFPRPDRNDWGHEKRAEGLGLATGEWVGWFNDDDSYDPRYVEVMMGRAEAGVYDPGLEGLCEPDAVDVVFCDWNGPTEDCSFAYGSSTSGNFIVRTELARCVGWTSREYAADGIFIDALVAAGARVAKVPMRLYRHNEQPWPSAGRA